MGKRARDEGTGFESVFRRVALRHGIIPVRIPEAGRWIKDPEDPIEKNAIFQPIKTLCDFVLLTDTQAAFVDCKSIDDDLFSCSMIKEHQIETFRTVSIYCPAGYVICYRLSYRVVFVPWLTLSRAQGSVRPEDGVLLGLLGSFDPRLIFATFKKSGIQPIW